jgi:hypothetical protein
VLATGRAFAGGGHGGDHGGDRHHEERHGGHDRGHDHGDVYVAPVSRKARMNLRHAAALALVGWYLMMPPLAGPNASNLRVDLTAKLSQWEIVDSFDSADVCRVALLKDGHWAEEQAKNGKFESENQRVAERQILELHVDKIKLN